MKALILVLAATLLIGAFLPTTASAKKKKRKVWTVTTVKDPITDSGTCVVAAYDQFAKREYSRMGFLYPIVEKNDNFGLLVGVSSGGKLRLPTGGIIWRVDKLPHREFNTAANPPTMNSSYADSITAYKTGDPKRDKIMEESIENVKKVIAGLMSTSTVASGEKAVEVLQELMQGKSFIFRAVAAAPAYGLPSANTYRVGQQTNKGSVPIYIDDSFFDGLETCGITVNGELVIE